eukprot:tig00020629_g12330.t1
MRSPPAPPFVAIATLGLIALAQLAAAIPHVPGPATTGCVLPGTDGAIPGEKEHQIGLQLAAGEGAGPGPGEALAAWRASTDAQRLVTLAIAHAAQAPAGARPRNPNHFEFR